VKRVTEAAHALKSVFATLCADRLQILVTDIENGALRKDWDDVQATLRDFDEALAELKYFINRTLSSSC
jgi:hypothetical protein